jgi:hypothetical protein
LPEWVISPFGNKWWEKTWKPGELAGLAKDQFTQEEAQALQYGVPAIAALGVAWLLIHPEVVKTIVEQTSKVADAIVPDLKVI